MAVCSEFSGLENTEAPLVPEQGCLQVLGAGSAHPFSALWPHTMMEHFLLGAGGMLKRLRNTTQDMGTYDPTDSRKAGYSP